MADADRSRDLARRILAALPEAVIQVEPSGRLLFNAAAAELFGFPEGSASLRQWHERLSLAALERESAPMQSPIDRVLAGESFSDLTMKVRPRDGRDTRIVNLKGRPLYGADGLEAGILTARDVTDTHRTTSALRGQARQLRIVLEALPVGVWLADADGHLVYNNPAGRDIWGDAPHPDVSGYGQYRAWRPDSDEPLAPREWGMYRAIAHGEIILDEVLDIEAFDGTRKTILHSALPFRDADGALLGGIVINVDITERRAAEQQNRRISEALETSLAQLQAVFDNVDDGLGFTDPAGKLVRWNAAGARMLGYTEDVDLTQVDFSANLELYALDGLPIPAEQWPLRRALNGETFSECEYRLRRTDNGLERVLSAGGTCVRDGSGAITLALVSLRDITDAKHTEAVLRESLADQAARVADFQTLMDAVPAVVFVAHDAEAKRITGNQACYDLLRLPPRSNVSQSAPTFPRDAFRVLRDGVELAPQELPLQQVVSSGEPLWGWEEEVVFQDGDSRHLYGNAVPLFDDAGKPRGAVAAFVDITERKCAEDALRLAAERFRVGLSHTPVAIFNQDAELRYVWGHTALPGCDFEAFTGCRDTDILEVPEQAEALEAFKRWTLETGRGSRGEFALRIDGVDRVFDLIVEPWRDERHRVRGLTGAAVEISARKALESRLRENTEALIESDRRKDEFLAMLAHELRNPLTPIHHSAQFLARAHDEPGGADGRLAVEVIRRQVAHLTRLVDDLLDVARITRGRMTLRKEPVQLGEVLPQALETVAPMFEQRKQRLIRSLPSRSLTIIGDHARLVQVVGNLLHNASKYTPEGGEIRLSLDTENGDALIRVKDTGVGIRPEMLSVVFDLFNQAAPTLARTGGGLGLGLALVQSLVAMHGGTVEATSPGEGQGSEFVVRLPLACREDRAAPAEPFPSPGSAGGA